MTRQTTSAAPPSGKRRREAILQLLQGSPEPLSINDIATRLDMHVNTVRFHLDGLLTDARVERAPAAPQGAGRPKLLFTATPGMDPTGVRNYRLLAELLVGELATHPDAADRATAVGDRWGAELIRGTPDGESAVDRLNGLLADIGFQPSTHHDRISLRHCPFLDLIDEYGRLLCPLHLGIMRGALEAIDAPVTVRHLEPFARPDRCDAHLMPDDRKDTR